MIAYGKIADAFPDPFDDSRPIAQRDETVCGGNLPNGDQIIVIVQRAGVQPHLDFALLRCIGLINFDHRQALEPAGSFKFYRFHKLSLLFMGIKPEL